MPSTPTTSPPDAPPPSSRRRVLAAGALLALVSLLGALGQAARLDATEQLRALGARAPAAWASLPDGRRSLSTGGAVALPARGLVRLRACVADASAPELTLVVTDGATGAVLGRARLTRDEGLSRRCLDGAWRSAGARRVAVALTTTRAPPTITALDLRAGGAVDPRDLWPALAMVLGVGLVVLAARLSRGPGDAPAAALPSVSTIPEAARGYAGFAFAVLALAAANAAAQVPVLRGGMHGATMLASMVLQQGLLALAAAWLMGALRAPSARVAMELTAPPAGWGRRALSSAAGLLAVALVTGLALKDAGDSPIARAVEAMPTRYVIAFGAVCAPLPEELFFRGVLGRLVASVAGERRPALVIGLSALIFTLMHAMQLDGALLGLIPIASLGLVNGWLRWSTRGLVAPWAVHTLYNGALALSALA